MSLPEALLMSAHVGLVQGRVDFPHLRKAANKARMAVRLSAIPARRIERVNIRERSVESSDVAANRLQQFAYFCVILWRVSILRVAQFNGMNVVGAVFGIDHQHAAARVTFALACQKSGSAFPLAGSPLWVGLGVVGQ